MRIVEVIVCTKNHKIEVVNPFHLKEFYKTFGPYEINGISVRAFSQRFSEPNLVEEIVRANVYLIEALADKNFIWH